MRKEKNLQRWKSEWLSEAPKSDRTFARLLKLPNVTKPLVRAGEGPTGPASVEGV